MRRIFPNAEGPLKRQSPPLVSRRQEELLTLLDALHSSSAALPNVQELDELLESILSELTEELNFEYATISLVDEYRDCIETVRGRNVSPGWIIRAKHGLTEQDIQTYIVNTGRTEVIVGWNDLLDKDIYDRFDHWRLARVWAPILSGKDVVVGTIEAGCNKEREGEVLTQVAIERVKQLGIEKGDEIARRRPHVLLENIASHAVRLIGADSATLHVYRRSISDSSKEEGREWGELILAAGAGRATPEFVKFDKPRGRGRGRKAIETGEPECANDTERFEAEYPVLYALGVRALAVVPLKLGPDAEGVLGFHFWEGGKRFTSRELNLAAIFAHEMEGVIQNYLLLRRATEAGSRAWALSGLQSLMQSLTSPFSLPDVLRKIARNALLTLNADNVLVYQYDADKNQFYVPPVLDGQFIDPTSIKTHLSPGDAPFEFASRGVSQFIVDANKHPFLAARGANERPRFTQREKVKSCAVLVLRSPDSGEIVGLIFVNFGQVHSFSSEEKRTMDALATSAALAIRNARLHRDDLKRQLQAMHQVHAAIAERGPDLKHVLEALLQQTVALTGAKYSVCMRWNDVTQRLETVARCPIRGDYLVESRALGEGIVGLAAASRKSILVQDVEDRHASLFIETVGEVRPAEIYIKANADTRCEIAVPLLDEERLLGVLNIEHPEPHRFTQDDRVLLQTLSVPAIIAFHTVDLYKRLERRIRHLKALNLIAACVQRNPYDLETILRLFLTGITAGTGLGFSRAMLFLADKKGHVLRGEAAIGPVNRREAEDVWERFGIAEATLAHGLDRLLRNLEKPTDDVKKSGLIFSSRLNTAIRQVSIPIDYAGGAPALALLRRESVTIACSQDDPFRKILDRLTEPNDVLHAFVAVPVIGHAGSIGVLIVDNRYLWGERAIDAEDVAGLEAFAGLLGLTIENARLQQEVTEKQRVENWKEVTGSIAHTMGTLLFEVKGDIWELRSRLTAANEDLRAAPLEALFDEVNNDISLAEKVLFDFRTFASPPQLKLERIDLRRIVEEVFQPIHGDYLVDMSLLDELPVLVDSFKLSNALREIRKNAQEAMLGVTREQKVMKVKASATRASDTLEAYAQLEITDNGPGLSEEILPRLFKPYVTTKSNGTGLGLAIAKEIIAAHRGSIEATNSPAGGATFVVRIPMIVNLESATRGASDG